MSKYFLGNVFNDRFNMPKAHMSNWGDTDNVPHDDYERAMCWYDEVRKQYDLAEKTYRALIDADRCATDSSFLDKPCLPNSILSYQQYEQADGRWTHRHIGAARPRESAEQAYRIAKMEPGVKVVPGVPVPTGWIVIPKK